MAEKPLEIIVSSNLANSQGAFSGVTPPDVRQDVTPDLAAGLSRIGKMPGDLATPGPETSFLPPIMGEVMTGKRPLRTVEFDNDMVIGLFCLPDGRVVWRPGRREAQNLYQFELRTEDVTHG